MSSNPTYSLDRMLELARKSLAGRSNFSFDGYADGLWRVLEGVEHPNIQKRPRTAGHADYTYDFGQADGKVREVAVDTFYELINLGFVVPSPPSSSPALRHAGNAQFRLTSRGEQWANSGYPVPEDYEGYLSFLRKEIPGLNPVIQQYVSEGLRSLVRRMDFAAAVMIGAASEKAIYLLAEAMTDALSSGARRSKLTSLLSKRKLYELLDFVDETIEGAASTGKIPYAVVEGADRHLASLFESIRIQRNDAVHPMNAQVSADAVRLSFSAFPHALKKAQELRDWLANHPQAI